MKKKFIPYSRQWIENNGIEAVVEVLRSDLITQGPKIEEFEEKLAEYCGAEFAVAVSSGTAALHIACLAAGIGKNDEVITSPITFVASSNCVLYCGGRPVFADIEEDTANINPDEIKKKVTKSTKTIIPVHFAGQPADMEEIYKIAKERNLIVIEDACHALGAEYRVQKSEVRGQRSEGRGQRAEERGQGAENEGEKREWVKVGSCEHSDMAVFSFHPVKHITTGEGGAVLTNNEDFYERLKLFRNHGITKNPNVFINKEMAYPSGKYLPSDICNLTSDVNPWYYEMQELGYNYRITDFQCALGIKQIEKIGQFVARRREIAVKYNEAFKEMEKIIIPHERENVRSSYHLYVIQLEEDLNRREIFSGLRKEGIGVQVHYLPVHLQPYYQQNLGYRRGDHPKAEQFYERVLSLPLFPKMSDQGIKRVIEVIQSILRE